MINKLILSYLTRKLMKLIRKFGMKYVLLALIEMTDNDNEDYMRRLNQDLRTALKNYENRY